jgi:STE24 endopeptidase
MQVPVNVRDDRDAHRRRPTVAKGAALVALAGLWLASGALLWRTEVPRLNLPQLEARDYFPSDALERIGEFRRVSRALFLGSLAVELVVLGLLVWKAGALADALAGLGRGRVRTGVLVGIAVALALWLAALPFAAASHRWRRRYGLSEQGYDGWLRDQAVSLGVQAVLVALAVAGALWLAGRLGGSWWLAGAPALVLIGVLFILAQPLVVQPLFNRFEPLPDRTLAHRIEELAERMDVHVDTVQVADASRRTTTANAYVAGIGPTRRVVLYDTILDGRFTEGELLSVSAHELAHVGRRHLWKGLAWFALLAVPGVWLVARLTEARGGLAEPRLVPLALTAAFVLVLLTQPFTNLVSRRYEAEADWLALEATRDPESAIGLDRRLVLTSLADPDPPAWVRLWLGTHPPPLERIAMAESFRGEASRTPGGS